ncbi:MAG: hypothetical protein ACRDGF_00770 [Chloroflexota bacterium]
MTLGSVLALLATALAVGFVLWPLRTGESGLEPAAATQDLVNQRNTALRDIRDVDFDYELGNLSDEDYRDLRDRYKRHAVDVLKAMNAQEGRLDDEIEQAVAALRRGRSSPT